MAHRLDEQTLIRLPRHHNGTTTGPESPGGPDRAGGHPTGRPPRGIAHPASTSDRIQLEEEFGWLKVILAKGTDKLLGATVVSKHAGELIFPAVEMLQKGRGLKSMFGLILPYPTRMEMWNRAALTWRARRFAESSFTQKLVRLLTGFEKKPTR